MPPERKSRNYLVYRPERTIQDLGPQIAENDSHLAFYYVGRDKYVARALNREDPASVFLGPKGMGKSAILQMVRLENGSDRSRIIDITPDDLAFSAIANASVSSPIFSEPQKTQFLFKTLWDYILSMEILKREYRDMSSLESLITKLVMDRDRKDMKRLFDIGTKEEAAGMSLSSRILNLVKEIGIGAKVGGVEASGHVALEAQPPNMKQLNLLNLIANVAKRIPDKIQNDYYVLIDDLDLHWTDSPEQNAFLGALFLSLRRLNRPPHVKCVVSLRDNIFKRIPFEDKDKYRDSVCHVEWDRMSVRQMVQRRVAYVFVCNEAEVWDGFFDRTGFDWMWNHTMGMPREIIRLAQMAIGRALANGSASVRQDDLEEATRVFSQERLDDFASIQRFKYPGLLYIAKRFKGHHKEFGLDRIQEVAIQLAIDLNDRTDDSQHFGWAGVYADDPKGLAKILLEVGFLLYKDSRTAPARPYDVDHNDRTPDEIPDSAWYAIHPMFGFGLGLVGKS